MGERGEEGDYIRCVSDFELIVAVVPIVVFLTHAVLFH